MDTHMTFFFEAEIREGRVDKEKAHCLLDIIKECGL